MKLLKYSKLFFSFFSFNLTAIFNNIGYLKQNESSIYQSESY